MTNQKQTGTQGGTHEQHVEAGKQSHKNQQHEQSNTSSKNQQGDNSAKPKK